MIENLLNRQYVMPKYEGAIVYFRINSIDSTGTVVAREESRGGGCPRCNETPVRLIGKPVETQDQFALKCQTCGGKIRRFVMSIAVFTFGLNLGHIIHRGGDPEFDIRAFHKHCRPLAHQPGGSPPRGPGGAASTYS